MRRNQWTAVFFAIFLFVCGAIAGALIERFYSSRAVMAKTAEDFRHHYVAEMRKKLNLTEDQVNKLQAILDETKARYKAVRDSYRPEMLKVKQEQIEKVKSILTPQQVPEYERLVAEHEQRGKEQEERERLAEQKEQQKKAAEQHSGTQ